MPITEGYLSGVSPNVDVKNNGGNAIFRTRNFHWLGQDPAINASESFNASKILYKDASNGTLRPEDRHNTTFGAVNTKGYFYPNGKVYAAVRDASDPNFDTKYKEVGPEGLNLKDKQYVGYYYYGDRGNQWQNNLNTIKFPRPIIDYARFAKGKGNGRMDYEKALYARQLMNGLRETMLRHGIDDKYLKKIGAEKGFDSFSGNVFDDLRYSGDARIDSALADFLGVPLWVVQSHPQEDTNDNIARQHEHRFDDYYDDYNNLSNFMKENYGDAAYSDGYTETPVQLYANGGRLSTRHDNIFSQSHIFADGGKMKQRRSEPLPETVDYFSRLRRTPMTIGEINRINKQLYDEESDKAYQEWKRDQNLRRNFVSPHEQRDHNRWFDWQTFKEPSYKYEEPPEERINSQSQWLNPLSPEWLKIYHNPNPKQKNENVTTQPRTAQNSETSRKSNNQVANTNDEIDKLALDVIRGKYGNGKQRREALGDLYSVVQKRANEMLKGKRSNKNSSTRESQVADAYRKAWDETPEEWKQPLKSVSPRSFNPRSYDLTTDDLRLHELASQQAQQERSLDENPHSLIRDNGEIKRRIGGTNNYDIYL